MEFHRHALLNAILWSKQNKFAPIMINGTLCIHTCIYFSINLGEKDDRKGIPKKKISTTTKPSRSQVTPITPSRLGR